MVREPIVAALAAAGHRVTEAADGQAALELVGARAFDLAVCDVRMPRLDGLTLLRRVRYDSPETDVVIMTSYAQIPDALSSLRDGAVDYVSKPFDPDHFAREVVGPIDERRSIRRRFERARQELAGQDAGETWSRSSRVVRDLAHRIAKIAFSDCPVLVTGEAGTGKKLVAKILHARSSRRLAPLVVVPCATLPELMLESELRELSDPGGPLRRDAWFRAAAGGTLVLDGVDRLPVSAQASLLRALQEPEYRARTRGGSGSRSGCALDRARAAQAPSELLVGDGTFLGPLFYRLNTVHLHVPALREREGDLYVLTAHLLRELAPPSTRGRRSLSRRAPGARSRSTVSSGTSRSSSRCSSRRSSRPSPSREERDRARAPPSRAHPCRSFPRLATGGEGTSETVRLRGAQGLARARPPDHARGLEPARRASEAGRPPGSDAYKGIRDETCPLDVHILARRLRPARRFERPPSGHVAAACVRSSTADTPAAQPGCSSRSRTPPTGSASGSTPASAALADNYLAMDPAGRRLAPDLSRVLSYGEQAFVSAAMPLGPGEGEGRRRQVRHAHRPRGQRDPRQLELLPVAPRHARRAELPHRRARLGAARARGSPWPPSGSTAGTPTCSTATGCARGARRSRGPRREPWRSSPSTPPASSTRRRARPTRRSPSGTPSTATPSTRRGAG